MDTVLGTHLAPILEKLTALEGTVDRLERADDKKTVKIAELTTTVKQLQEINARLKAHEESIDQLRDEDRKKNTKILELTISVKELQVSSYKVQANEVSIDQLRAADGQKTAGITDLTTTIEQLRAADAQKTAQIKALSNLDGLWIDVDPADGADFDISREYRLLNADGHASGSTLYPIQVSQRFLMFEQNGATKSRLNHQNKAQLLHCEEGNFENKVGAPSDGARLQVKAAII